MGSIITESIKQNKGYEKSVRNYDDESPNEVPETEDFIEYDTGYDLAMKQKAAGNNLDKVC